MSKSLQVPRHFPHISAASLLDYLPYSSSAVESEHYVEKYWFSSFSIHHYYSLIRTSMFTAALFTIARTLKQSKCPSMDEWTENNWYRILLSHKKKTKNAICSNMDGPRDCHTEQSKSDRERQNITWYHFYMESKKKIVQIYKIEVEPQM